ncbi:hypothetical protein TSUD_266540, partial [Trifolium subterraneum]
MDGNEEDFTSQVIEVYDEEWSDTDEDGSDNYCTRDGSVDFYGKPAIKNLTGGWKSATLLLVNQGLVAMAFSGVEANLVIFLKLVLKQTNVEAANTFSLWMGTTYFFSLIGAFLSDSLIGRYLTTVIFQFVFIIVRSGVSDPALPTLGADQFDEEEPKERRSKALIYGYFYVALNLGSLVAETVLAYIATSGHWVMGFWICTSCASVSFLVLLSGTLRYRHYKSFGNPFSKFIQACVSFLRKMKFQIDSNGEGLYGIQRDGDTSVRRIHHTNGLRFLDRAAIVSDEATEMLLGEGHSAFIQMLSLFVEQGSTMDRTFFKFQIPPSSMTAFDIITTSAFILLFDVLIIPLYVKVMKRPPKLPGELQSIGIGLVITIITLVVAGFVETQRLEFASKDGEETSSLSIFWLMPQYLLLGVAEAFVNVAQMNFFTSETPDGLEGLGMGLSMFSSAIGCYVGNFLLTM